MGNEEKYKKLINTAKEYYEGHSPELCNLRTGDTIFDLEWCPQLTDEINFWTYWHGRGNLDTTEILLVGQDFGAYRTGNVISPMLAECIGLDKEAATERYVAEIRKDKQNKTDQNLIELFSELGEDYNAGIYNEKLFFTNLCLGYRSVEKISGGDVCSQMKHDSIYLKALVDILRPKVVICLGADTFASALTGLSEDETNKDDIKRVWSNFYDSIHDDSNHFTMKRNWGRYEIFGFGHTGHYGVINRNKYEFQIPGRKENPEYIKDKLTYMRNDWRHVKEYL